MGILLEQIMQTSSGNSFLVSFPPSLPPSFSLNVKLDPYLLNIRRDPLEEIQYFIIVNGIRVAKLLGKFVNTCENKRALIKASAAPAGISLTTDNENLDPTNIRLMYECIFGYGFNCI